MTQAWIDDNSGTLESIAAGRPNELAKQIFGQLAYFDDESPTLYRGMSVPKETEASYRVGSSIDLIPSSFSPNLDYAGEFAFGSEKQGLMGVMFRVRAGARGINLANYVGSEYLREIGDPHEVVTGGRFRVIGRSKVNVYSQADLNYTLIDLEQTAVWDPTR
jgi:hypothetical protein